MNDENAFCTIITRSHLPYACALRASLSVFDKEVILYVLMVDETGSGNFKTPDGMRLLSLKDLSGIKYATEMQDKYMTEGDYDRIRWSMKPILMSYLLRDFQKIIYVDSDIFFFNDYSFLFEYLEDNQILLTPHWLTADPRVKGVTVFRNNFIHGIYNAGFIAVNKKGGQLLTWWIQACLYKCEKETSNGFFDDQTYLSLLPILFKGVHILKHRGCNVAGWNYLESMRLKEAGGQVLVRGKYPIIFIHFSIATIDYIHTKRDPHLAPFMTQYQTSVLKHKEQLGNL